MSFDGVPLWVLFPVTVGLVALTLEVGFRLGKQRQLRTGGKSDVSGAMVGATMSLLAFMLAFTFNGAAGRHDIRKSIVIEEANAIDKAFLRTSFLAEPYRTGIRGLLKSYVDTFCAWTEGDANSRQPSRQRASFIWRDDAGSERESQIV